MTHPAADLPSLLARCQTECAALLRRMSAPPERAAGLADLLLRLLPEARRAACVLAGTGPGHSAVRPSGAAEEHERFGASLTSVDGPGVHRLADGPPVLASAMEEGGRRRGVLAVELSEDAGEEGEARAGAVLAVLAGTAALGGSLEGLRAERAELVRAALVGQAFVGLAHDLNNLLNSMMLQTSVVQLRVDEAVRHDLAAIRQQGAQAAGLVRSLQHVVQERREQAYPVDLNAVLVEVLEEEPDLCPGASLALASDAPSIHSTRGAVKQLVRLLLAGASAAAGPPSRLATEKLGDGAALVVETGRAAAAAEAPPTVDSLLWDNLDEVDRQAGRSLLRQLGGAVEVDGANLLRAVWAPMQ